MNPEEQEGAGEQSDHKQVGPIEQRIFPKILGIRMGFEGCKSRLNALMTLPTLLVQVGWIKDRPGILPGKHVVACMAVCTSGNPLRQTDAVNLPMVAFIIGRHRMGGKLIAFG